MARSKDLAASASDTVSVAVSKTKDVAAGAAAAVEQTMEILEAGPFYYAEAYHQQYLAKNPNGYCGLGGTGVACQIGTGVAAA